MFLLPSAPREYKCVAFSTFSLKRRRNLWYEPNLAEIPKMLLDLLNDKELLNLFSSQAKSTEETSSSSVMENTEASES